jgi:hypothetical protein
MIERYQLWNSGDDKKMCFQVMVKLENILKLMKIFDENNEDDYYLSKVELVYDTTVNYSCEYEDNLVGICITPVIEYDTHEEYELWKDNIEHILN